MLLHVLRETNLKIKQASPQTFELISPQSILSLRGRMRSEQPDNSLYTFEATLVREIGGGGFSGPSERQIPIGPDQLLLRGAQLRNTPWVYGIAVFTGHETKLMKNATSVSLNIYPYLIIILIELS
jgi:phospholipid-transporting ATPase